MNLSHPSKTDWTPVLMVLAVLAVLIFAGIGLRDPWPPDEPRFALMAKQMVDSGQWMFPFRGGEIYPDKPPLLMWTAAFFYWLTGNLKLAFLLPSAISSLLVLVMTWDLTRKLWDEKTALYALILLGATAQFMLLAKSGQLDAMVSMWVMLGCYGLLKHILRGPHWRWYFAGWFAMGLGIITKGVGFLPVFLLIPLFWTGISWQHTSRWDYAKWLAGPIFMLAAVCVWLVPMLWQVELQNTAELTAYKDNILLKQTAERYTESWAHIKPVWYYLVEVIPVYWMPMSLLLFWLWKPWSAAIKAADKRIIIPLFWVLSVLIFFTASSGKRQVYLLPVLPILAMSIAPYLSEIVNQRRFKSVLSVLLVLSSAILVIVGLAGVLEQPKLMALSIKHEVDPWFVLLLMGILSTVIQVFTWKKPIASYLMTFALYVLTTSFLLYPLLDQARNTEYMMQAIEQKIPADAELGIIDFREKLLLHSRWPTVHFGYHTPKQQEYVAAKLWMSQKDKRYLLINDNAVFPCVDKSAQIEYDSSQNQFWPLYTSAALSACTFTSTQTPVFYTDSN
jgi:4-amino-4-deoxy-L-arabinose transferase-like glycosyltransferase